MKTSDICIKTYVKMPILVEGFVLVVIYVGGLCPGGLLSGRRFCHKFAFGLGAHGKGVYSGRARTKKIQIPQNLRRKLCGRLT